jgi:hypothetical protein
MVAAARIYAEWAQNGVQVNGHGARITGVKEREQSRELRVKRSQLRVFRYWNYIGVLHRHYMQAAIIVP